MILIFSNRKVNLEQQGADIFLPCENPIGGEDVLLATATSNAGGDWSVTLIPSLPQGSWNCCEPSRALLSTLVRRMNAGEYEDTPGGLRYDHANKTYNWIFFVPGYSSTAKSGLQKAKELEKEYQANVMLYSWPADPPASNLEAIRYREAQAAARVSAIQLDQTLEGLNQHFSHLLRQDNQPARVRFCMLIHSLGNYLFESYARDSIYSGETNIFDSIILHQPDISQTRLYEWVDKISFKDSLYLTYNTYDSVLRYSMLINDVRAGIAGGNDPSKSVKFIDFTHGRNIGANHFMFTELNNEIVKEACRRMIRGVPGGGPFNLALDGANGFTLHPDTNTYVLSDPDWQTPHG